MRIRLPFLLVCILLAGLAGTAPVWSADFIRGDTNADGVIDVADAIRTLEFLFQGDLAPCEHAIDANQVIEPVAPQLDATENPPELPRDHQREYCDQKQDGADIG